MGGPLPLTHTQAPPTSKSCACAEVAFYLRFLSFGASHRQALVVGRGGPFHLRE